MAMVNRMYPANDTIRFKCLSCFGSDCFDPSKITYCYNAIRCWSIVTKNAEKVYRYRRGCIENSNRLNFCNPRDSVVTRVGIGEYFLICCRGDLCNNESFPSLSSQKKNMISFPVLFLTLSFLLVVTSVVIYMIKKPKNRRSRGQDSSEISENELTESVFEDGRLQFLQGYENSSNSGSGFGAPLLQQRTLAKQVVLKNLIGRGRYGDVWQGLRNDSWVAVKLFRSSDEASWRRENEIYNAPFLFKHSNILCFIGSDMTSFDGVTSMWLIMDYHPLGSLYDYLNTNTVDYNQMFKLIYSIANGINYLHQEIGGIVDKPAIAHRDIKSKNILVKNNGECAIADFGLVVTYYRNTNKMTLVPNSRVGTKRYMAPEVLDEMINTSSFDSYKRADIYSLGLVFWEISWRTVSMGVVEEYKLPYHEYVDIDPSFEEMLQIVTIEKKRPKIPDRWASDRVLSFVSRVINECWHDTPSVRPTSLRFKKTLQKFNL